jgi:hypothetical protein
MTEQLYRVVENHDDAGVWPLTGPMTHAEVAALEVQLHPFSDIEVWAA